MRYIIIVKATAETEAGSTPAQTLNAALHAFHRELGEAGVLRGSAPTLRDDILAAAPRPGSPARRSSLPARPGRSGGSGRRPRRTRSGRRRRHGRRPAMTRANRAS